MSILKQSIGIDCSKDELEVGYGVLTQQLSTHIKATTAVCNSRDGIDQLIDWASKFINPQCQCIFVVEATGVYHQQLARQLHEAGYQVCVILPNKAAHFQQTLSVRTVTDQTAARMLTQLGLEKQLEPWGPPDRLFARLKQLTRERKRLKDDVTRLKNQRHAGEAASDTPETTSMRINQRLDLFEQHIGEIEAEIREIINENKELKQRFEYVCSIQGVGLITAVTVVSEADGFNLVRNVRQLVCYAGYDVVEKQSGSSVKGKPKISKQGNTYIRRALYFPAITAVGKNPAMSTFYHRLHDRHSIPMKAYTAVQRKLLILIYTLWTKQEYYRPNYHQKEMEQP